MSSSLFSAQLKILLISLAISIVDLEIIFALIRGATGVSDHEIVNVLLRRVVVHVIKSQCRAVRAPTQRYIVETDSSEFGTID